MNYQINNLIRDEYGRVSGILAIDKPIGLTSHDVVYRVRKALDTKKVGHAGSLDPFATGVLIVLVGKATGLSDEIMAHSKSYTGEILFGISTDSHDPEGIVTAIKKDPLLDHKKLQTVLATLKAGYEQDVPIYSSVKVNGDKLRVLARRYHHFRIIDSADKGCREAIFFDENDNKKLAVALPHHFIQFDELEVNEFGVINKALMQNRDNYTKLLASKVTDEATSFPTIGLSASCPKGTYLRQLAYDIGVRLDLPAMLIGLRRTRVGEVTIDQCLSLEQLTQLDENK